MSCLLPPEILDHVIDQLPDDVTTLKACCLVSRSWIQRARKHLFANLSFDASTPRLELWKNTFPDSTNSPAHHTRTLFISYPDFIRAPDTILTFCNVERLDVIAGRSNDARISLLPLHGSFPILRSLYLSFYSLPDSGILDFICSFPLLEDLTLDCFGYGYSVQRGNAPSTSPRLSGSFKIKAGFEAARSIVRRLLDLPNGIHFAKISVPWVSEKDVRSTMDLVLGCANTLQSIDITTYRSASGTTGIDLSKAVKLRDVVFRCAWLRAEWITKTLYTVESKNLHSLSLELPHSGIEDPVWEVAHREWLDLDRLLVQFWDSHKLRSKVIYAKAKGEKDAKDEVAKFFPELTRRGIVDLGQRFERGCNPPSRG